MHFSSPHYVELVSERCSNSLAHFISSSEAVLDIHDAREKKLLCLVMRMRLNNKNSQITFNNLGKTTFEHKNNVLGTLTKSCCVHTAAIGRLPATLAVDLQNPKQQKQ